MRVGAEVAAIDRFGDRLKTRAMWARIGMVTANGDELKGKRHRWRRYIGRKTLVRSCLILDISFLIRITLIQYELHTGLFWPMHNTFEVTAADATR